MFKHVSAKTTRAASSHSTGDLILWAGLVLSAVFALTLCWNLPGHIRARDRISRSTATPTLVWAMRAAFGHY